ncbi:hypothetical protein [Asticcacaulis sp. EMRT-3]|uniref:hypothetical protein n=1 Tax=Asticcacaulis sp. EMRT-3 TaxID=3040349 RepID=UPI0024AF5915|nr:hypothetical protein [Asticcacaulis sp. EMRT-3]MDI7774186.1 hypothetical protein [Asticcacaulis sp. EMRT-3]
MPDTAEPHHVPHGYKHPAEHHHWWWYAGLAAICLVIALIVFVFRQFDQAASPLCNRETGQVLNSPNGTMELSIATTSCLGGKPQIRLMMRRIDRGSGDPHTVVSFDDKASVRAGWVSDHEVLVSQKGGQITTFEPIWHDVRIHYKK